MENTQNAISEINHTDHPQSPEHRRECAINFGKCWQETSHPMPKGFENKKVANKPTGRVANDQNFGSQNN